MAEKILNTRFQLRYDTYANWTSANPELKKGEIAVAILATDVETNHPELGKNASQHPILFKVGTGSHKFNELPWASALAADVYDWAKQSENDFVNTFLALEMTDGTTMQQKLNGVFATDKELSDAVTALEAAIDEVVKAAITVTDVENNPVSVTQEGTVYTVAHDAIDNPTETNGAGRKYLTGVTTDGYGHIIGFTTATEVNQVLPGEDEFGVLSIDGEKAIKVDNTDAQNPVVSLALNNTGNVKFTQDDNGLKGDVARVADADHADAATKVDHALTVKIGNETKTFDGSAAIEADVDAAIAAAIEAEGHPEYSIIKDATSEYAATYHLTKDGVNIGAAINIPKDLVVESGKVETLEAGVWGEAGTYIVLTLANATNDKIYVNVGSLIEYVTSGSTANDQVIVNIDDNHKVTATIGAGKVGTTELADKAVTAAKLNADVDTHVNGLIDEKINALDVNDIAGFGAGKTLATLIETDGKIAATFQDIAITESQITDLKDYALKSELPVVNDGGFTVSGTGYLTGSGSMTANQSGNTTAEIDLSKATKDVIDHAVQSVTAPAGSGLIADRAEDSNDITIGFDPNVIFVFDGGTAFDDKWINDPTNA